MVKRALGVLLPLLLWGCPDDFGAGMGRLVAGLRTPTDLDGAPNGGSEVVLTWRDHATVETGYRVEMNPVPFGTPVIGGVEYLPANATTTAATVAPPIATKNASFRSLRSSSRQGSRFMRGMASRSSAGQDRMR